MATAAAGDGQTCQVGPERSRPVRSAGPVLLRRGELPGRLGAVLGPVDGAEHADRRGLGTGRVARRDSMKASPGSSRASSCTRMAVLAHVGHVDDAGPALAVERRRPCALSAPKRIGSPWTSGMSIDSRLSFLVMPSKAPSLKTLQFW